jgi:hypothetical protein
MVVTVLEAEISPKKWDDLKTSFENMTRNPPAIAPVQAFLVQSAEDVNIWQMIAVWRSREEFDAMRNQGVPRGVKLFRDAGAEPSMSVYDVAVSAMLSETMPMSPH